MIGIHINLFIYIFTFTRMSMIYTLVARERNVLTDYTSFSGNFSQVALEVLNY